MPEDTKTTDEALKAAQEELDRMRREAEQPMPGSPVINHPKTPQPATGTWPDAVPGVTKQGN